MTIKKMRFVFFLLSCFFFTLAQTGDVFAKDRAVGAAKIQALNDQIIAANEARDLPAALRAAEEAVRVAKAEFGEESLQAADTMNNLASLYLYLKRAGEAEQLYRQALLIDLEKLDPEGTEIAETYFNLGVAYAIQKKYRAAINILNKALLIRMTRLGPKDQATKNAEKMIADLTKLDASVEKKI